MSFLPSWFSSLLKNGMISQIYLHCISSLNFVIDYHLALRVIQCKMVFTILPCLKSASSSVCNQGTKSSSIIFRGDRIAVILNVANTSGDRPPYHNSNGGVYVPFYRILNCEETPLSPIPSNFAWQCTKPALRWCFEVETNR